MNSKGELFTAYLSVLKDALKMVGGTAFFRKRELFDAGLDFPGVNAEMSPVETCRALEEFSCQDVEVLLDYTLENSCDYCDTEEGKEFSVYILGLYLKDDKVLMDGFAVDTECNIYTFSKRDLSTMGWIDLTRFLFLLSVKTTLGIQLLGRSPKRKNEVSQLWAIVDGRAYCLTAKDQGVSLRTVYSGLIKQVKAYLKVFSLRS